MDRSLRAVTLLFLVFLTLLATINNSFCNGNSNVVCIESERQALLSFRRDLIDPSSRLSSWALEENCCQWAGVVCDNLTGHVIELHLQHPHRDWETRAEFEVYERSKLGGKINHSLLNLKHLSYLDLSYNDFGGIQIPSFIGSLGSLRYLNFSEAGFEGMIPHQLGNLSSLLYLGLRGPYPLDQAKLYVENLRWLYGLTSLEHLDISQVNLSKASDWLQVINLLPSLLELHLSNCELDHIPSLPRVNFTSLSILDISWNSFNSLIPKWIFSLSSLISLDLSASHFEGPIPSGIWNLTSLKAFDVSFNYLNSLLPNWLFSLNDLVSLNLHDNGFEGPIPSGLRNMTGLRDLDLSENDFNSTIPNWLYSFSRLELLDLHSNNLEGIISSAIANLTSATALDFSYNEFEGAIPRSLGNLCNLEVITLSGNKFGGEVSECFKKLSGCISDSLVSLNLGGNNLSGQLPNQLGQFKNLAVLYLGGNSISGPIPVSLGSLSSLIALNIAGNQLNGTLPESLGLLSKLEQLDVSYNLLEGVVSEVHFANLTNLTELYASGNSLVLKVSSDWIPRFQLGTIEMRSWHLGPQFPMWLKSQKHLGDLDLSCTGISDTIPTWFWNSSSQLTYLNLSHNQIHGEIPYILRLNYLSFSMIYLSSNQFRGPLPRLSSSVTELDLSNNSFSGNISHFLCVRTDEPNELEILHLGENLLSGEIPDCWMNWQSLKVIKLGNNNLTGNIPSSMGYLGRLRSLHLRDNSLSGELPQSLRNCTELITLDLGVNDFTGSIPTWMGSSLSNLKVLSLRSNKFTGKIPLEFCDLSSLQNMDLANNNLSGTIPPCFNNLKAMVAKRRSSERIFYSFYYGEFLENAFVVTKGREFQYDTILTLVVSLDLSSNNLSGEVPEELTSLLGLLSLNLSNNHLTGRIPEKIGDMGLLESLDISRNQLFGKIPPSMSSMTFLNYLNLSYNNLSGKIPLSTQLQSLNASSFVGNQLCGPPLTENCSANGMTPNVGNRGDEEGDGSKLVWFYLSILLGFVVGFWGVCGPLLFNKSWRCAYFLFLDHMWHKLCVSFSKFY